MSEDIVMKVFKFVNDAAKRSFLELPKPIVIQFGTDLQAVQNNNAPFSDYKHLAETVGPGAIELIENGGGAFRVVYCAKFNDTVFVLHAFTKKTNGVDVKAMKTAKERYKLMLRILNSV